MLSCALNRALSAAYVMALCGYVGSNACVDHELADNLPNQAVEQETIVPARVNRSIDILFVIDDSGSMSEEQASLADNFVEMIDILGNIEGGLPSLHLGVVSTNVGSGGFDVPGCAAEGDNGMLQSAPATSECASVGRYVSDTCPDATDCTDPANRSRNYDLDGDGVPTLSEAFSCIARLGTRGCSYEQPLESLYRALSGCADGQCDIDSNTGFLRPDALLALIIISDEDDCSASNELLFDNRPGVADGPLGPAKSFRCFEFGVVCDPDEPRVPGTKHDCAPRADSMYLTPVTHYVDFVRSLKPRTSDIIVSAIAGAPTPVVVERDSDGDPALAASCQSAVGTATPATRTSAFVESYSPQAEFVSICDEDIGAPLRTLAELLRSVSGSPCLKGALQTEPLECQVVFVATSQPTTEYTVPRCADPCPGGDDCEPCWLVDRAPECASTPSGLRIRFFPEDREFPAGSYYRARCRVR